jgi:hypothetical protein
MGYIYRDTKRVIIFLGPSEDDSDLVIDYLFQKSINDNKDIKSQLVSRELHNLTHHRAIMFFVSRP